MDNFCCTDTSVGKQKGTYDGKDRIGPSNAGINTQIIFHFFIYAADFILSLPVGHDSSQNTANQKSHHVANTDEGIPGQCWLPPHCFHRESPVSVVLLSWLLLPELQGSPGAGGAEDPERLAPRSPSSFSPPHLSPASASQPSS